ARIFIRMEPSEVTWGVTRSSSFASTNTVFTPAAETWEQGIETPCPITASRLSRVVTLGAETVLSSPLVSRAERRRLSCAAPPAEPKLKPMAPPELSPTPAGKLTAQFGCAGMEPPAPTVPGTEPEPPMLFGKARPVAFPDAWFAEKL